MSDNITRYELPPQGITLLGYIVRRMHKTEQLASVPALLAHGKSSDALTKIAMYTVSSSTSFGRAYYQPQFNSLGSEVSEPDPLTGAMVTAKLVSTSPHYFITYTAIMPGGDVFSGSEEIAGTIVGLRGIGMPAPSKFNFRSDAYGAELTGTLTSELTLSLIGHTRIRAYGFLNFKDNAGNAGKLTVDRNNKINFEINNKEFA
jgi:hypothetical protein